MISGHTNGITLLRAFFTPRCQRGSFFLFSTERDLNLSKNMYETGKIVVDSSH